MLISRKSHPLQWFSLSMGFTWIIMGLFSLSLSAFLSVSLTLGGFGWFLACLLMDPRARRNNYYENYMVCRRCLACCMLSFYALLVFVL